MDDKGIQRIAIRLYRGWLWDDGHPLLEHVRRVADHAGALSGVGGSTIRWAALLSAAPTTGIRDTELLRLGVPPRVVSIVDWLRPRSDETPMAHVERVSTRRQAAVILYVQLSEIADAELHRYHLWRDAHRRLGDSLGLPTPADPGCAPDRSAREPAFAPIESTEHWDDFANAVVTDGDPKGLDRLLLGYANESRECCRRAIQRAIYAVSGTSDAARLVEKWWDSTDSWEAMIATRATRDTDRLRSRLDDERPQVTGAAVAALPEGTADPAVVAALGRILRRADPYWRWCRTAAARRLLRIGGPAAEEALRHRVLAPLDPPWRDDPRWLAAHGAEHIPELIANLEDDAWWYEAPYALGRLGAAEAVPAICRRLRAHPNWSEGVDALGRIGSADAVETLLETAVTGSAKVREHSLCALTRISTDAAVSAAIRAMDDFDPTVRERAARIIARYGDRRALITLIKLCDSAFAGDAARTLGRIADPRAEPTLWKLFVTGTPRVRSAAGRALAEMPGPQRYLEYSVRVDPGLRRAFVRLLGHRRDWPNSLEYWTADPDPRVRSVTAYAIATRGLHEQREVLDRMLADPDERVRKAAGNALGRLDNSVPGD